MKTLEDRRTRTRVRVERTYIKERRKSIRARSLDCNDGAARRVAPANGHDPKLRSESCLQVSLPKTLYGENTSTPFKNRKLRPRESGHCKCNAMLHCKQNSPPYQFAMDRSCF